MPRQQKMRGCTVAFYSPEEKKLIVQEQVPFSLRDATDVALGYLTSSSVRLTPYWLAWTGQHLKIYFFSSTPLAKTFDGQVFITDLSLLIPSFSTIRKISMCIPAFAELGLVL